MAPIDYSDVAVWLPTLDEELNITKMIGDIELLGFKVYVTDGGSSDATVALARQANAPVYLRPGRHKGYGIRQALEESAILGYKKIIYIDCDQTYPIDRLPELYALSEANDIVVGARDFSKIVFINRMVNYFLTGLINILFSASLSDTQSGMRILRIDKFIGQIRSEAFDLESELTCFALRKGLKMKELPVDYYKRVGDSKTSIVQAFIILRRILICRFMD